MIETKLIGNLGIMRSISQNMGEVSLIDTRYNSNNKSGPLTISIFQPEYNQVIPPALLPRFEGRIFFGNGGIQAVTPFFQITRGMSIPIQANYLRLNARLINAGAPATLQNISAFVCEGASPKVNSSPVCVNGLVTLNPGDTTSVSIPDFAKTLTVWAGTQPTSFNISLVAPSLTGGLFHFAPNEKCIRIPLGNAYYFDLSNEGNLVCQFQYLMELEF